MSEVSRQSDNPRPSVGLRSDGTAEPRSGQVPQVLSYLDTSGAAERLRVSPRTLIDYRSRGGGPKWVRLGRAVRYRTDWLDHWADEKAVTSTSQETARTRI